MGNTRIGQGATEYLVLLAVVLIIALVGIALLGFFPGTATDAQAAESQLYWSGASPISIVEMHARYISDPGTVYAAPYLKVRNSGPYAIRITKMLGNGQAITVVMDESFTAKNISDLYYLAPGEEKYFASKFLYPNVPVHRHFYFSNNAGSSTWVMGGATALCANGSTTGTTLMNNFGFEYVQYVEGQEITKRQIGTKPLIIKCEL